MTLEDLPRLTDEDREALEAGGIAMEGVPESAQRDDADFANRRPMAMLPNDWHPGPRCSCGGCTARYPEEHYYAAPPSVIATTKPYLSVTLLLSVTAYLLEQARERAEGGWFDMHSLHGQARQVLAEALDRCQRGAL